MSVHIDEVLDYLDQNLVCRRTDGMPALMEVLQKTYMEHGGNAQEVIAFSHGVLTGMLLMTEVNRLP